MTIYVPVVLTAEQAKAAANACALAFTQMAPWVSPDHPAFTAALEIEDAMVRAGAMAPLPRHAEAN